LFSGIIEQLGSIVRLSESGGGRRFEIHMGRLAEGLALGASVAINGVCLTVSRLSGQVAAFDAVAETLARTNLGGLRSGDEVHLERSLRLGDRIDGHFVQGHVECTGEVVGSGAGADGWRLAVRHDESLAPYLVEKGSIAIDGVSLTIARMAAAEFDVALVPTTLERTRLGRLRPGDRVNLESDILSRMIVSRVDAILAGRRDALHGSRPPTGVTLDQLRDAGIAP